MKVLAGSSLHISDFFENGPDFPSCGVGIFFEYSDLMLSFRKPCFRGNNKRSAYVGKAIKPIQDGFKMLRAQAVSHE
jgi:hypothetical protein